MTVFVAAVNFLAAIVVLDEGEAPRWPPKLSSSWKL